MGGGGDSVHYGVFHTGEEDLQQASANTVALLAELARRVTPLGTEQRNKVRVVDLGAGKGSAARYLAKTFGCSVVCFNLGENQNRHNLKMAKEEGIGHLVTCQRGSFNRELPAEWTASFDVVWSQESLCHAVNRGDVMKEIQRVLKPGGAAIISDVMKTHKTQKFSSASGDKLDELTTALESDNMDELYARMLATPKTYLQAMAAAGLTLVSYNDLTPHLLPSFQLILRNAEKHSDELLEANVCPSRLHTHRTDLANRLGQVKEGSLAWAAFVVRKPANEKVLVVGGGPVGSHIARSMSQCGVGNVTIKILPIVCENVRNMACLAGVKCVDEWTQLQGTSWGTIIVAVKTHWLPQIALEMECAGISWENLCLAYNGYAVSPSFFKGNRVCRAVIPQSFAFTTLKDGSWDIVHGNGHNPWTFAQGKCPSTIVGQLRQSGIAAKCSASFHMDAFTKFCVNNAANLLSVIKQKSCRQLAAATLPPDLKLLMRMLPDRVSDPEAVRMMRAILRETYEVLQLDPFFAAVVPMRRTEFTESIIFTGKGSVASYKDHYPSSYSHYKQGHLLDSRALNGYIMVKAKELNTHAPINEYIARCAAAIVESRLLDIPRVTWDVQVELAAAQRMIEDQGWGTSVWGHATARNPAQPNEMVICPFGTTFGQAYASQMLSVPYHPDLLTAEQASATNATAIVLQGAVYNARDDVGCVLHTHSPHATAIAAGTEPFNTRLIQDAMQFEGRVAYHAFDGVADQSEEMEQVGKHAKTADIIFLTNHGILVLGEDVPTAFSRLYYLERCSQVQLLMQGSGAKAAVPKEEGVKHTTDWYATDGKASAHAEWDAHLQDLLTTESARHRAGPYWYE